MGAMALAVAAALAPSAARGDASDLLESRKYYVPSTSMTPTLLIRDFVVAIPIKTASRGDLIAYRLPKDPSTTYLKRIVGMPGDRVQMVRGVLVIHGEPVKRERIEDFDLPADNGKITKAPQWRETLPGGVSHRTLDLVENGFLDNTPVFTVPPGEYFAMGDNRDNSSDSRLIDRHGTVPAANIIGRVDFIYFSIDEGESVWKFWRWPWSVRWGRIFMRVR